MVRPRFDPARPLVAARSFTYNGTDYSAGDAFNTDGIAPFKLNTLYGSRAVNHPDQTVDVNPVQMQPLKGGYYEITAPWLDEPEKVRGKVNSEARLAELREAGEPDSYKGVTIEGGEGGWYDITTDWSDEPEKVQGEAAARARANELRAEGPPPEHYALVTIEPLDADKPEGEYRVDAPWLDNPETVENAEAAEARADVIRKAGVPEGFDADKAAADREARRVADEEAAAKAADEQAEANRKAAFADGVTVSTTTTDGVTTYSLTVPGVEEAETFDDEAAATDRQNKVREAGPPEGWAPAE